MVICWISTLFGEPSTDALIRLNVWHWLASVLLVLQLVVTRRISLAIIDVLRRPSYQLMRSGLWLAFDADRRI